MSPIIVIFLMAYDLCLVPLVLACIFLYQYRYGFDSRGLRRGLKQALVWSGASVLLLVFLVFFTMPLLEEAPGPGDGLLFLVEMFLGVSFMSIVAYIAFTLGYNKSLIAESSLRAKSLSYYMISLNILCLLILLSGALLQYREY